MNLNGEIIVVEDDVDDREFLDDIFKSLQIPNKVVFFEDSTEVVQYLLKDEVRPFLVLSDINMPKLDGYELRVQIMANQILLKKCVPYIFLSTSKEPEYIRKAFELAVHGYFQKEEDFGKYKEIVSNIVSYWKSCQRPLIGW